MNLLRTLLSSSKDCFIRKREEKWTFDTFTSFQYVNFIRNKNTLILYLNLQSKLKGLTLKIRTMSH